MAGLSSSYPQYAPYLDLNAYLDVSVPNPDALLQRASGVIRDWTKTAVYRTDSADGLTPTDERVKNAFHDAAVLQAAAYYRSGIQPGDLAASQIGGIQSKSLGGRSVTYATDAGAQAAKTALLNGALAPEAASVLSTNGLLGTGVQVGGGRAYDILLRRWI
ncbi:head-to-tail adaptor [Microbacterium phage Johann]|uniref:Head-to-tail adaptor n=2 Tax=Goodmanvirus goodman TaxID=2734238 RepID=A0A3G3M0A1_9CAUD|nr:head-to-tail adaptor [Microbacterium phage Goodman]AYQ99469.1 head-to-tail adaptor [Microbacterium phage Goodman]AYQ99637.1 head-to-tail adaptor [Microbacterium phage Johann]